MNINKCLSIVAVSIVCLGGAAQALTEQWHFTLTNSACFFNGQGWQIVPDGAGGVACSFNAANKYYIPGVEPTLFTVILWLDVKGNLLYQTMKPYWFSDGWRIFSFDANHLVYGCDLSTSSALTNDGAPNTIYPSNTCVLVSKSGIKITETPVANCFGFNGFGFNVDSSPGQGLQNDKNGFFAIRYSGTQANVGSSNSVIELVRYSYK